ncbi:AAA family ATPase [Pseudoalteromonas shioyasakiensis]|uniref:AAA family ATPase n=1 Tax=Pseudoalteromonas shioyasakiensis TaxID=1190813 RepID=UPI002551DB46|nr:AAA family ATPase [Pseudoalteromonas shioyasakiensis]MDK9683995.1 AAA family ATPase [Pseudoalteromonas shioyasakiensis]
MKLNVGIKNFGKIKDAYIKIAPFTVIGGANASGKSFVSRALYSFFSTINKDHVTNTSIQSLQRIRQLLISALHTASNPSNKVIDMHHNLLKLTQEVEETVVKEVGSCTFTEQKSRLIILEDLISFFDQSLTELQDEIRNTKKYENLQDRLRLIQRNLDRFSETIQFPTEILETNIEKGFTEALKENFQAPNLSDLRNHNCKDEVASFNFDKLGSISLRGESISFELTTESVNQFQSLYNVVFIESPIYWKLRRPLQKVNEKFLNNSFFALHRKIDGLNGVPKYFYDLIELIEKNIKSQNKDSRILEIQSTLKNTLGGELNVSESGDIFYKEFDSSRSVNLNLTATGITNLGLIGLLLQRNVISEGSFIFVDEPEINLHPAWQKLMVKVLYQLSRSGVNIVITSHSIDMMKYIENIMEELSDSEIKEHFAVNRLKNDGYSINDNDHPLRSLAEIKEDLGRPFYEMMLESWN